MPPRDTSPDGRWTFDDGRLSAGAVQAAVFELDFHERWTFARFLSPTHLALAFETSQPWSEHGSYGSRHKGIVILACDAQDRWEPVALDVVDREYDESFEPHAIIWHPRGVLGWLHCDELVVRVLRAYRTAPVIDREALPELEIDRVGGWHRLQIDAEGTRVTASCRAGMDEFDLSARLHLQTRAGRCLTETLD